MAQEKANISKQLEKSATGYSVLITNDEGDPYYLNAPAGEPKILKYDNGVISWEDEAIIPETTVVNNLGSGEPLLIADTNIDAKTLIAGTNVSFDVDSETITINANEAADDTVAENLGDGEGILIDDSNVQAKSLKVGVGLTISSDSETITLNVTPTEGVLKSASVTMTLAEFQALDGTNSLELVPAQVGVANLFMKGFIIFKELDDYGTLLQNSFSNLYGVFGDIGTKAASSPTDLIRLENHTLGDDLCMGFQPYTIPFDDAANANSDSQTFNKSIDFYSSFAFDGNCTEVIVGCLYIAVGGDGSISGDGESTVVANSGSGAAVLKLGTNVTAKTLVEGSNITINESADEIEINATATPSSMVRQLMQNKNTVGTTTRVAVINFTTGKIKLPQPSAYPTGEVLYIVTEADSPGSSVRINVPPNRRLNGIINGYHDFSINLGNYIQVISNGTNSWTILNQ